MTSELTTRIRRPRPTSPGCGRRHRDDRRRSIQSGDTVGGLRERVQVRVALLNPRDLSDRSVPGMDEISAGGPGPDKPRTASTTC